MRAHGSGAWITTFEPVSGATNRQPFSIHASAAVTSTTFCCPGTAGLSAFADAYLAWCSASRTTSEFSGPNFATSAPSRPAISRMTW